MQALGSRGELAKRSFQLRRTQYRDRRHNHEERKEHRTRSACWLEMAEDSATSCSTSGGHGGAISIDMRPTLCSWGANSHGQLGQGHTDDQLLPLPIKPDVTPIELQQAGVSCIGGGGGFSFIVTGDGHLFTCGNNDRGQLGQGHGHSHQQGQGDRPPPPAVVSVFTSCTSLAGVKVTKAASGWDFMLALSESGRVYSWGSNAFGQLGRSLGGSGNTKQSPMPEEVTFPSPGAQIDIAAGLRHALSLSGEAPDFDSNPPVIQWRHMFGGCNWDGVVFAWGHGKKGQLGSDVKASTGGKAFSTLPQKVPNITARVKSLFAGMYHSGALDGSGNVFLWGCNAYGQCGTSPQTSTCVVTPTQVHIPCTDGERVTAVCSGWTHLVARTDKGHLYSWGRSNLGQLGRRSESSTANGCDPKPAPVEGLTQVTAHACGSEHNIALSESKVYTWGWNEHGICATGDETDVPLPRHVTSIHHHDDNDDDNNTDSNPCPSVAGVHGVGCGTGHTFAILQQQPGRRHF